MRTGLDQLAAYPSESVRLTQRGDKDLSSSSKQVVERIRDPYTEQSRRNVGSGIDESDDPFVPVSRRRSDLVVQPKFGGERQVWP